MLHHDHMMMRHMYDIYVICHMHVYDICMYVCVYICISRTGIVQYLLSVKVTAETEIF